MDTTFIYSLTDPNTGLPRYIGKSNTPKKRLYSHCAHLSTNTHKNNWIKKLLLENKKPILDVIDEVSIGDWHFWESFWICQYKNWGFYLTNSTNGSEGSTFGNKTSFKKGNIPWNKNTKGISKANSGSFVKGQVSIRKGSVVSEETKEKLRKANKCKPVLQFDKNMNLLKEHDSIEVAAKNTEGCPAAISKVCNKILTYHGKPYRSHKGFLWKFKNREDENSGS